MPSDEQVGVDTIDDGRWRRRRRPYVKFITVLILNICDNYCSNEFVDFRKMKLII
jgi:hypothetical protein